MIIDRIFFNRKVKDIPESPKVEHITQPIQERDEILEASLDCLAANSSSVVKKRGYVPPADFNSVKSIEDFKPSVDRNKAPKGIYAGYDRHSKMVKINDEFNPAELKISDKKAKTYYISNFVNPYGSIAISTPITGRGISTSGLFQCAGVAFVNKEKNVQTLLHLCPTINDKDNTSLINHIMKHMGNENTEITIVPGSDDETDMTIEWLMDKLEQNGAKNINFANYPDSKHDFVILDGGKLSCSDGSELIKEINPSGKLIHAGR